MKSIGNIQLYHFMIDLTNTWMYLSSNIELVERDRDRERERDRDRDRDTERKKFTSMFIIHRFTGFPFSIHS